MVKFKIKSGDKVIVTNGKDKGKTGTVLKIITKDNKLIVSGINIVKKHQKPTQKSEGGIISKEMPLHISNVAHIDPKSGKATKTGYKLLKDGTKTRFAKKSGEIIKVEGK